MLRVAQNGLGALASSYVARPDPQLATYQCCIVRHLADAANLPRLELLEAMPVVAAMLLIINIRNPWSRWLFLQVYPGPLVDTLPPAPSPPPGAPRT